MNNFVFHNPTKIIFGKEILSQLGKEVSAYGKKVLMVFGQNSIKQNGVNKQVMDSLAAAGIAVNQIAHRILLYGKNILGIDTDDDIRKIYHLCV